MKGVEGSETPLPMLLAQKSKVVKNASKIHLETNIRALRIIPTQNRG
jgi:hypothetical protein